MRLPAPLSRADAVRRDGMAERDARDRQVRPAVPRPRAPAPALPRRSRRGGLRIGMLMPGWSTVLTGADDGGVDAVVAHLVDGLASRGHEVHLVAAADGMTTAARGGFGRRVRSGSGLGEPLPELVDAARALAVLTDAGIDLVHDHTLAGPLLAGRNGVPTVVTACGSLTDESSDYYRALPGRIGLVAVSEAQRARAPDLAWLATVPNGIQVDSIAARTEKDGYLLWLGRYRPEDAPHLAIDAARAADLPIVLVGSCVEPTDKVYFREQVRARLGRGVRMHGVADRSLTHRLLAGARALVVPACLEEPSGLVLVEAMARGTPIVALARGAAPETVIDGLTGILYEHPSELAAAIVRAGRLDPADCRAHAKGTFDVGQMVDGYEAAYAAVLDRPAVRTGSAGPLPIIRPN